MSVYKIKKNKKIKFITITLAIAMFFTLHGSAYGFSIPFKKKKQEKQKIEKQDAEKSAVQIKAEHN